MIFWDLGVLRQETEFRLYVYMYILYIIYVQVKLIWMSVQHLGRDALSMGVQANLQVASSRTIAKNQQFSARLWSWISWCSLLA